MVRVTQPVLPLLPAKAPSVGASAGLLEGPDSGTGPWSLSDHRPRIRVGNDDDTGSAPVADD
jgi:hypothetical protein